MFRIRKEQAAVFRDHAVAEPLRKIVAEIERALPQEAKRLGREKLVTLVDRNIEKADGYGLGSERGICTYCEAVLLYGEDFDTNPKTGWSRDILPDEKMDAELKRKLLVLRIQADHDRSV